jgi:nucleoside diphosphate kinase
LFSSAIQNFTPFKDLPPFGSGGLQKTVAIIKPDAVRQGIVEEIVRKILARGYTIILRREVQLTLIDIKSMYKGERTDAFYDEAIDFINRLVLSLDAGTRWLTKR